MSGIDSISISGGMAIVDGEAMDLQTLIVALNSERVNLIEKSIADQASTMKSKNDRLREATDLLADSKVFKAGLPDNWSVDQNSKTINLDNGYKVVIVQVLGNRGFWMNNRDSRTRWIMACFQQKPQSTSVPRN